MLNNPYLPFIDKFILISVLFCFIVLSEIDLLSIRMNKMMDIENTVDEYNNGVTAEGINSDLHIKRIQKIASKVRPVFTFLQGVMWFVFFVIAATLLIQLIQLITSSEVSTFWNELDRTMFSPEYVPFINIGISLGILVPVWFTIFLFKQTGYLLDNLKQGAIFVVNNGKHLFNIAKYYLMLSLTALPAVTYQSYSASLSCQDTSFRNELFDNFISGFIFSDLVFFAMLLIIGHVITLAIRLKHEQSLTV